MIMSQTLYADLKLQNPNALIDVLAPAATVSLAGRMPEVNEALLQETRHGELGFGYRWRRGRELRARNYHQAIVTPNSLKAALIPFFAEIPLRTGFLGEYRYVLLNDIRMLDKRRQPRMVDRFVALGRRSNEGVLDTPADIQPPRLKVDAGNQEALIKQLSLDSKMPIVGLCPGAEFGDAKKWPEEHYAVLGKALVASGSVVWIFGSKADAGCGERIAREVGTGCINLTGKTSLLDAIDLLALCGEVVTNDSGLMHIAAAVGCRVVALYGSTSPGFTPPLNAGATILRTGIGCSPCFRRQCPLGHKDCLNKLRPETVLEVVSIRP
jgi:heptosyltransferase-2